jgi:hypothetical protein
MDHRTFWFIVFIHERSGRGLQLRFRFISGGRLITPLPETVSLPSVTCFAECQISAKQDTRHSKTLNDAEEPLCRVPFSAK